MKSYYFDNAATSWPKPPAVLEAIKFYLKKVGGNPGRSAHSRAIEASRIVHSTREKLAGFFNIKDPSRIVFTKNATEAINLGLLGMIESGDHVITTSMEHNSVMRPLITLEENITLSVVKADKNGMVSPDDIKKAIDKKARLVVCTHASNVTGTVLPVEEIGRICRESGVHFMVDAAQTAGIVPIDIESMCIDLLAFSGHKGLLGPQGTGGLYIGEGIDLKPLMMGGTGSLSDKETQPDFMPDKYESGTLNLVGISGLNAGIDYVSRVGIQNIRKHELRLFKLLIDGIKDVENIYIYGILEPEKHTGVLSFNVKGYSPSRLGRLLEERYGILTRIGLHCAPRAHKTIGTFPEGTVRVSWGWFNKEGEIKHLIYSIKEICSKV